MDEVTRLINAFKEEDTAKLGKPGYSKKLKIVQKLQWMNDERIVPFFLDVVANKQEHNLDRIEILEILANMDLAYTENADPDDPDDLEFVSFTSEEESQR